jgi:ABC-type multidrug transport system fused ATPase/permease subunit
MDRKAKHGRYKCVDKVDNMMLSAERILEYTLLPKEGDEHTELTPPVGWPSEGVVCLQDMSLYHGTKPVLKHLSVTLEAGTGT